MPLSIECSSSYLPITGNTNVATTSHPCTSANGLPMAPHAPLGSSNHHSLSMSQHDGNYDSSVTSSLEPNQGVFNAYISLRNVVASFQVKCYLTLRTIALNAQNVEYKRESGVSATTRVVLIPKRKMRLPYGSKVFNKVC